MKRTILFLLAATPFLAQAQPPAGGAQNPGDQRRRIEAMEVAYMTRELNLSSEDAQKFWPVFNKYRDEMKAVQTNTGITDPLDKQQRLLDVRKKYRNDFNRTLGQERGMRVFQSEDRFRQMAKGAMERRNEMRNRMGPGRGPGGGRKPMMNRWGGRPGGTLQ
jgi:hypothetical protein